LLGANRPVPYRCISISTKKPVVSEWFFHSLFHQLSLPWSREVDAVVAASFDELCEPANCVAQSSAARIEQTNR